jgi:predicted dehydrogenase
MKFLVAGCGSIGRRHISNLLALGLGDVIACDPDEAAADAVARSHGVRAFTDIQTALAETPDAVFVCTPTHGHLNLAEQALKAGAHLFIEKPLAVSLAGTDRLAKSVGEMARVALVGCNMRFHPGVTAMRSALEAGLIGQPYSYRAHVGEYLPDWRPGQDYRQAYSARAAEGGGIVMEGVHEIDYLRWLGGEVTDVRAMTARTSDLEIDAEDVAEIVLRLESGALAHIHLDYLRAVKARGCEVIGPGGLLIWASEGKPPRERVTVRHYDADRSVWSDLVSLDSYDGNEMYLDELRHFSDCLSGKAEPMLDIAGARRVLEIALQVREEGHSSIG